MIRFNLKQFFVNSTWDWFIFTDRCAICRNDLNEPSIEHQLGSVKVISEIPSSFSEDSGSIAMGKCKHSFHLDCIEMWLNNNSTCPLCSRIWNYHKLFNLFLNNH